MSFSSLVFKPSSSPQVRPSLALERNATLVCDHEAQKVTVFQSSETPPPTHEQTLVNPTSNKNLTTWRLLFRQRPLMRHYYAQTDALVFVVDSNDRERMDEVKDELHRCALTLAVHFQSCVNIPVPVWLKHGLRGGAWFWAVPGGQTPTLRVSPIVSDCFERRPWRAVRCCCSRTSRTCRTQ